MTSVMLTAAALVFVVGVLALVAYALYECTPLAHRFNPYRDSATGRRHEGPHVDDFRDYS
jgi:hypothetical protein